MNVVTAVAERAIWAVDQVLNRRWYMPGPLRCDASSLWLKTILAAAMFALRKQSLRMMMSRLTEGWRYLTTPFAFATSGVRLEEFRALARSRSASDPGYADGVDRHQRDRFRLTDLAAFSDSPTVS
jgi:hypothetical protein